MRVVKYILVAAMLGVAVHASAQDIHFSQPDVNPILFNPAYSGFFSGSGRFAVTYRNQWASVTQAFQTIAANGEYALSRRRYQRDGVSIGAAFFSDRAGTLNYGTTAATAVLSYYKSLNRYNNNFLSAGLSLGFAQSGFDPAQALMRDDEAFARATLLYPLFGLGVAWFYQPHEHFYIKTALSGQNLNRPALSYTGEADLGEHPAYLERRYLGTVGYRPPGRGLHRPGGRPRDEYRAREGLRVYVFQWRKLPVCLGEGVSGWEDSVLQAHQLCPLPYSRQAVR